MSKNEKQKSNVIRWPQKFRGIGVIMTKLNEQKKKDEIYDLLNIEFSYLGYAGNFPQDTFDYLFDLSKWLFDVIHRFQSEFPDLENRESGSSEHACELLYRVLRDNYGLQLKFQDFRILYNVGIGATEEEIFEEQKLISKMEERKQNRFLFPGIHIGGNPNSTFNEEYDSDILNTVQKEENISETIK